MKDMKKVMLLLLIGLIAFDVDAQMMFDSKTNTREMTGFSAGDEFSSMLAQKRKKRKSSKRRSSGKKRGKSSSGSGLNVGGGLTLGLPMGDFGKAYKMGIGLNLEGDYFVMPEVSIGVSTGYVGFKYKKDILDGTGSFSMVPFMVKLNYYFGEDNIKPYAGLGIGLFMDKSKYEYSVPVLYDNPVTGDIETLNIKNTLNNSSTDFGLAPAVGALFTLSDNVSFNASARYNMFFVKDAFDKSHTYSFLGINLGLVYTLGL